MKTRAFRMNLHPGMADEYRTRHDQLWPELADALLQAGIVDYRIFLDPDSHALFAVMQHEDQHLLDQLPELPVMQRWWQHMKDIMPSHPDGSPVSLELVPMFELRTDPVQELPHAAPRPTQ
ncbi:L-rhamnose mutarotase [Pseudomonas sp. RIT-To-2]|uniref:L-rhamnose mutarotase n=1 Tax=Pseudomonas sp. RIT-To-2 TaxID=3462541 RepID=UPI0024130C1D